MTVEWTAGALASARRYMRDQAGMRAVSEAVAALSGDPFPPPPGGFHRGAYHRLRACPYRVTYAVDGDVITVERVDRLTVE